VLGATRRDGNEDQSGDGRGARARSRSQWAGAAWLLSASAAHTRRSQTGGRPAAASLGAGGVYATATTTRRGERNGRDAVRLGLRGRCGPHCGERRRRQSRLLQPRHLPRAGESRAAAVGRDRRHRPSHDGRPRSLARFVPRSGRGPYLHSNLPSFPLYRKPTSTYARAAVDPTAAVSRGRSGCRRVPGCGTPVDHTPAVGAAATALAAAPSGRARAARAVATAAAALRAKEPLCGVGRCGRARRRGCRRRQRWPTATDGAATCATAVAASASAVPTLMSASTPMAGRSPARRAATAAAAASTVGAPGGNKSAAGTVGLCPPAPSPRLCGTYRGAPGAW